MKPVSNRNVICLISVGISLEAVLLTGNTKYNMRTTIILLSFIAFFTMKEARSQNVSVAIGYQSFYDELSPYGTWVDYPGYGYVWKYRLSNSSFRPYSSRGHWVYTEYGWTWASDYSWGWATFHYGRWMYDDYLGWLWIPGNEWAPAWVTWGSYNNDFCWAPIGPNVDISMNIGYRPPANYWVACPGAYFGRADWNTHVVNITHNTTVVNNITIIRNTNNSVRYSRGPEAGAVERYTKAPVRAIPVGDNNRPGADRVANNRLAVYRPAVHEEAANRSAPKHPENVNKFRPENKPMTGANPYHPNSPAPAPRPVTGPVPGPANPNQQPKPAHRSNPVPPPPHPTAPPRPGSNHPVPSPANRPGPPPAHPPVHAPGHLPPPPSHLPPPPSHNHLPPPPPPGPKHQ